MIINELRRRKDFFKDFQNLKPLKTKETFLDLKIFKDYLSHNLLIINDLRFTTIFFKDLQSKRWELRGMSKNDAH